MLAKRSNPETGSVGLNGAKFLWSRTSSVETFLVVSQPVLLKNGLWRKIVAFFFFQHF